MSENPLARLYLVAPAGPGLGRLPDTIARLIDKHDIACVRIAAGGAAEDDLRRAADTLRPVCHERDVPLLMTDHFRLVTPLGLDGVHLTGGARTVRAARKDLAKDAIVGAYSHASRHDGMTAGEIGADYVAFGPLSSSSLGDGKLAPFELFQWWSEMIEVPVVAEGGLTPELAGDLAGIADFISLGDELWSDPDGPEAAMRRFLAAWTAAAQT
jgi:thiamine-phosphate pyrophosphorylase